MASRDRAALVALFRSTGGASWSENTNWDTDVQLSEWHRVEVDDEGRVVSLKLGNNNLQGMRRPTLKACRSLVTCFTFPNNSSTESGPVIQLQVLQQATTLV